MLAILVSNTKHQVSQYTSFDNANSHSRNTLGIFVEFYRIRALCVCVCVCVCESFWDQTRRSVMLNIYQRPSIIRVHNLTPDLLNVKHGFLSAAMSVRSTVGVLVDNSEHLATRHD